MKPYPRYKPFPEVWLPRIPSSWSMRKIKYLFRDRSEKGFPNEPLLAATQNHGVIPKTDYENRTVEAQKDLHLLKLVRVGDFVISLRSFQGGIEYAYHQGIISPAYTIMVPLGDILPGYFRHLAKSGPFLDLLKLCVTGIREGQNIDYERLKKHFIPLPSPDEQARIVQYLDEKTAAIDELVRAKERQIELLRERKQALVSAAVTRGLDPAMKLNDSGVSGIGKIPEGWQKDKITRVFSCIGSGTTPPSSDLRYYENGTIPWINSGDLSSGNVFIQSAAKNITRFALENCPALKMYEGDTIVVAMYGASIGNLGIATFPFCANQACCCLSSPKPSFETRFLYYSLVHCKQMWLEKSKGGTQPNISQNLIRQTWIPFPPLPEQHRIVAHLDSVCADYAAAETAIRKQIALLQELRTRLVSDAVTGAVEV